MVKQKLRASLTTFTPVGDYFVALSPHGIVKFWSTSDEKLLAEWSPSCVAYSCMACSFIGKKKKGRSSCLLVLGLDSGEISAFDVFTGEKKWETAALHSGGIACLSFTNRGHIVRTVGNSGMASEISSETGEVVKEFKISKRHITCSAICADEDTFAISNGKVRVFSWDNGKEILKFSPDEGSVQRIFVSEDKKAIITSSDGEKNLQVWKSDTSNGVVSKGPILRMRHAPVSMDCKSSGNGEEGIIVLSVTGSGVAYIWNLKLSSEDEVSPIKVVVQADLDLQNGRSGKKNRSPIVGARLQNADKNGEVKAVVAYGAVDSMHFSLVDLSNLSDDIVITAEDKHEHIVSETGQEDKVPVVKGLEEKDAVIKNKKISKKRSASEPDLEDTENMVNNGHKEQMNGSEIEEDINEPTMGEKLASLNLQENNENKSMENEESSQLTKPPSADSVHVLMKQALHADDRALLLNCLYTQDEKVIANSVSVLSPSDVLKLLDSLISIIHSRGVVVAHALPWLRSLLLQHASGLMSQESSLLALNSLYQLIEARVSTFAPALQLSSCLNLLYKGAIDDGADENDTITPVIFEDKDSDEESEESEDAMDTDEEAGDPKLFDNGSGSEIDDMNFD